MAEPCTLRSGGLPEAVRSVSTDLDLPALLVRLVEAAVTLLGTASGALGVLDATGTGLSQLLTAGLDDGASSRVVLAPTGRGVFADRLLAMGHPRRSKATEHIRCGDLRRQGPVPPHSQEPRAFLGVPVQVGAVVFGHLFVNDKLDGSGFSDADEQDLAALALAGGVAVGNAQLYGQARRGSAWREAGRTISTALLAGADREDVIALLVETSQWVLDASSVFMGLAEDGAIYLAASAGAAGPGTDAALLSGLRPVLRSGQPQPTQSSGLTGFAVPLGAVGETCGGVLAALWSTPPHPLLVEDLQSFAAQAAVALELADRRDSAQQGALIADRDRIGRDLHDLVIQRLFATGMRLQSVLRLIASDPGEAERRVDLAVDDLDVTIRELRSTIHGLQAPLDGRPSLRARLLQAVDTGSAQLGFAPALRLDGLLDTVVPPDTAEHALAVVREGLSNAARHAHAVRVEVTVGLREGYLQVTVEDDGVGVDPAAGSSGLRNLASRALELGGELTLDAGPLAGSRLIWRVPVQR